MIKSSKSWFLAARPKTLTAAVVPVLVATSLAYQEFHQTFWWVTTLSLLASIFIQIGTNLVNDAVDFKKGADTESRIGPQRVTQAGIFAAHHVLWMGTLFFALAVLCGIPLFLQGGWPILIIGIVSVLMGYGYTAGPFPLAYLGLGDLFVILFFGLIAVGGIFYLHSGAYTTSALISGLQVGFHCTVLIAINNLRDSPQDSLVNKRTLPVRFGIRFARAEIAFLIWAPFFLGIYWLTNGHRAAFLLPLLITPLAYRLTKLILETEPSAVYNQFLARGAGLHLLFAVLFSTGLFL